jgi:hypothetical protein
MELNDQSKAYLYEIARWATILSIIGFVVIALLIMVSFSVGTLLANSPYGDLGISPQVLSTTYLIIAGVYFIPIFFLYQFGLKTKYEIDNNDTDLLTFGLKKLKSHYKFIGIVMIIMFGLNILFLLIGMLTALFV